MARGSRERRTCLVAAFTAICVLGTGQARGERSNIQTLGVEQGLVNLGGTSLAEDEAGDLLISTESGVVAYDGRRFVALGAERGLRRGGEVFSVAVNASGRVAIQYPDEVYVSTGSTDAAHPATSLTFMPVAHPGVSFYSENPHRLVPWGSGFVFLSNDAALRVVGSLAGASRVEVMPYDRGEWSQLARAAGIFSIDGHLWETFVDGRVCRADPGAVACYSSADGLGSGQSFDLVGGSHGEVLARSATSVSTYDPNTNRWILTALPDQGGSYDAYRTDLGIYRAPDGSFVTQAVGGIDVLGRSGWSELTVKDGAPSGTIVSAMTDRTGQFWFHVIGRGLVHWLGFGQWSSLERSDGLSEGVSWQTARSSDGALWVTTDSGLDKVVVNGTSKTVVQVIPGSSYAIATAPTGDLLAGNKAEGYRVIHEATGASAIVRTPAVASMLSAPDRTIWIGTNTGLYRISPGSSDLLHPSLVVPTGAPISNIKYDGKGGVYYLSGGRLRHWHAGGTNVVVAGKWTVDQLQPVTMAIARDGAIWLGGSGGLYRLVISNDRIVTLSAMPLEDTRSSTTYAIMVDHRGWLWFGTDLGITVFNGRRWVSADVDQGLLSNGVSEDGIREDRDGSVWIATDRGVSHLRDPASLFTDRPIAAVVTKASLGPHIVEDGRIPFSREPLLVELGTPNHGVERSVEFRYRMSGVDATWVTSASGVIRYPFVPPGSHELTVIADDVMTHRQSIPTILAVKIGFPWYRQSWAEAVWVLAAAAFLYVGMRFRYRSMYARQAELERRVDEATACIRHQAAHDEMTGLLVRREVEQRLAKKLEAGGGRDELVVALLDVDHFKTINDTCGHLGGDEVLRAMGRIIRRHLRADEFAGRYGGEEALLVLDDRDGEAAERVLNLHLAIRHDTFNAGGKPTRVTCSIGVAWALPGDRWETLIGRADKALYEAKHSGRDRVAESRQEVTPVSGT